MADESNVVPMRGLVTTVEVPPADALEKAKSWGMERCIIVGVDAEGRLIYGASYSEGPHMNWVLDRAKADLLGRLSQD